MDFLDTVAGGIENAVGAVLAPVADTAGAAAATLRRELTQTWHGVFGSPTMPGGTNWNAYSHEELYAMVHDGADPGQVGEQAAVLDGLGRGASEAAEDLTARRGQVAEVWEGRASSAFGSTLDEHSAGGAAVAEHAAALSSSVLRASEALSRAQAAMPEPVDVAAATAYGAAAAPGPAFALGAVTGAGSSWFAASLAAANKKAEAVEVMQAFESSLTAADPPEAPTKLPPGVPGGVPLPAPRPEVAAVAAAAPIPRPAAPGGTTRTTASRTTATRTPVSAAARAPATASPAGSGPAASPGRATTGAASAAPGPTVASAAATSPAAAGGQPVGTGTSPSGGNPVGVAVGGRRGSGGPSGWASGPDGRAGGRPVAWHELVGRGGVPGLLADADHRPARTAAAPGAVPANSRREEDREHHNRMPRADKLFALDDKTPPPVIGA